MKTKKKSKIGNNVFIGCNVNIVAPVNIADDTYICAGTTVTNDTEDGDFVIGRVRQENKKRRWCLLFFIPFWKGKSVVYDVFYIVKKKSKGNYCDKDIW